MPCGPWTNEIGSVTSKTPDRFGNQPRWECSPFKCVTNSHVGKWIGLHTWHTNWASVCARLSANLSQVWTGLKNDTMSMRWKSEAKEKVTGLDECELGTMSGEWQTLLLQVFQNNNSRTGITKQDNEFLQEKDGLCTEYFAKLCCPQGGYLLTKFCTQIAIFCKNTPFSFLNTRVRNVCRGELCEWWAIVIGQFPWIARCQE